MPLLFWRTLSETLHTSVSVGDWTLCLRAIALTLLGGCSFALNTKNLPDAGFWLLVGVASIDPVLWFEDHHCGTFSRISSWCRILCVLDFLLFCLSSGDPPRDSCLTLVITWGKLVFQTCGVVHPVLRTRVGVTHLTAFPTVLLAFLHPFCRFFFSLSPFLIFLYFCGFCAFLHPNLEASTFLLQSFFAFFRFLGALFGCLFWSFSGPFCCFWLFLLLELCFFLFFPAFSLDYLIKIVI